jgi:hypothetical protein
MKPHGFRDSASGMCRLYADQIAQVANGLNDGFLHGFVCFSLLQKVSRIKPMVPQVLTVARRFHR